MDILEAIDTRISCRAYDDREIEQDKLDELRKLIEKCNEEGHVNMQLYGPRGVGETAVEMAPNMFVGRVYHYIACVAEDTPQGRERIGYYGEKVVLLATQLGLGTCWVASTYYQDTCRFEAGEGEALFCIIPVGYAPEKMPLKQRTLRAGLRARDKKLKKLMAGDAENAPEWFTQGVAAAQKAPTAVNAQPVVFTWDGTTASAAMPEAQRSIQDVDLGICKLHFELGSKQTGTWEWGEGGSFRNE